MVILYVFYRKLDAFHMASISPMEKDENDEYKLPHFHASLFATILEDAITQIRILAQCNNELNIAKVNLEMQLLLAIKFNIEQIPIDDLGDGTGYDSEKRKMDKLNNDRKLFAQVCLDTYKDLSTNNSYKALARHVTAMIDLDHYRVKIVEEEAKNRQCYKELRKQLRHIRRRITSVNYEMDVKIEDLRTETEDFVVVDGTKIRYVDGWQQARTEQHIHTINKEQLKYITVIEYYKQREEHEQRVHSEIEMFINITINETLDEIGVWMDKYEADGEAIDLKIQIQKNSWQDIRKKRTDLEATLAKREDMIREWIEFKEERERKLAYKTLMDKSAITVQAWWRGMLVRRCLGPYAIKKQKKRGKKV